MLTLALFSQSETKIVIFCYYGELAMSVTS